MAREVERIPTGRRVGWKRFLKKKKIRLTYGNKKKKGKSYEEESRKNIYMYIRTYVSTMYT